MKFYWIGFIFTLFFISLISCSGEQKKVEMGILHPNDDSELTLLMRDMYNYYDSLKVDIKNGDVPENIRNFAEIHSAVATEPSKSESDLYKAMSSVYLESANRLNDSETNLPKQFNIMVDNCMNCHRQMCPGPMVKIKKLYLPMKE